MRRGLVLPNTAAGEDVELLVEAAVVADDAGWDGLWPHRAVVRRGARWDGIVPHVPGDGVVPSDETPPEGHLRALAAAYYEEAAGPGEVGC
jgi:hypothetical protein